MILPEVNVLIHAFRQDAADHSLCRSWLNRVVLGDAPFGVSPLVLNAVVRITTGFSAINPSSLEDAFGFCDDILELDHCRLVEPGEWHWDIFRRLCMETDTRGRRVTDAWFAALAIEWGCEWITLDRDFARFPGLRWRAPSAA